MGKSKNKLKRAKNPTKGMLLFMISGIVCECFSLSTSSVILKEILGVMAVAFLVAMVVWDIIYFRCPHCHRHMFPYYHLLPGRAYATWSLPQYCPRCKQEIIWY